MRISLGREIHATLSGSSLKSVCCEQCSHVYDYTIDREGVGEGFAYHFTSSKQARSEAEERAARDLRKQLQQGQDIVPCPVCGHVQVAMVEEARSEAHGWLTYVALLAGLIFIYTLPFALNAGRIPSKNQALGAVVGCSTGVLAFGSAFLQAFLRKRFNPNDWPLMVRLEIARARCVKDSGTCEQEWRNWERPAQSIDSQKISPTAPSAEQNRMEHAKGNDTESVSIADHASAMYFYLIGFIVMTIGVLLLAMDPKQWRAFAAFGLAGFFWFFGYHLSKRET